MQTLYHLLCSLFIIFQEGLGTCTTSKATLGQKHMSCLGLLLGFPGTDLGSETRTGSQGRAEAQPLSWNLFLPPQRRLSQGGGGEKERSWREQILTVASIECLVLFALVSLLVMWIIYLSSAKLQPYKNSCSIFFPIHYLMITSYCGGVHFIFSLLCSKSAHNSFFPTSKTPLNNFVGLPFLYFVPSS